MFLIYFYLVPQSLLILFAPIHMMSTQSDTEVHRPPDPDELGLTDDNKPHYLRQQRFIM
jgi:hypothetical protein